MLAIRDMFQVEFRTFGALPIAYVSAIFVKVVFEMKKKHIEQVKQQQEERKVSSAGLLLLFFFFRFVLLGKSLILAFRKPH